MSKINLGSTAPLTMSDHISEVDFIFVLERMGSASIQKLGSPSAYRDWHSKSLGAERNLR